MTDITFIHGETTVVGVAPTAEVGAADLGVLAAIAVWFCCCIQAPAVLNVATYPSIA